MAMSPRKMMAMGDQLKNAAKKMMMGGEAKPKKMRGGGMAMKKMRGGGMAKKMKKGGKA
jgi:hypothetical protein|tara:strand:+ start:611 stop:787 length:177 start_codon:yes stop_codon:yes gene_type:complete